MILADVEKQKKTLEMQKQLLQKQKSVSGLVVERGGQLAFSGLARMTEQSLSSDPGSDVAEVSKGHALDMTNQKSPVPNGEAKAPPRKFARPRRIKSENGAGLLSLMASVEKAKANSGSSKETQFDAAGIKAGTKPDCFPTGRIGRPRRSANRSVSPLPTDGDVATKIQKSPRRNISPPRQGSTGTNKKSMSLNSKELQEIQKSLMCNPMSAHNTTETDANKDILKKRTAISAAVVKEMATPSNTKETDVPDFDWKVAADNSDDDSDNDGFNSEAVSAVMMTAMMTAGMMTAAPDQ